MPVESACDLQDESVKAFVYCLVFADDNDCHRYSFLPTSLRSYSHHFLFNVFYGTRRSDQCPQSRRRWLSFLLP